MVFPYKTQLKEIQEFNEYCKVGFFLNGEKAIISSESVLDSDYIIFPKDTILSSEAISLIPSIQEYIDEDFRIKGFSLEGELFEYIAFPINEFSLPHGLDPLYVRQQEYNKNIKYFKALESQNLINFVPDYSVDPINYKFEPEEYNNSKSQEAFYDNNTKQYFLNPTQIEKLLEIRRYDDFKEKNINERDWLISLFSNRTEPDPTPTAPKKVKILPAFMPVEGYFTLPANTLENQPDEILTTAGLYIFNMYVITAAFKHKIPYINHELNAGKVEKLNNDFSYLLLENKIQVKGELEVYFNNLAYISYMTEMLMPGLPIQYLEIDPDVEKLKKELLEKYKTEIQNGEAAFYADHVEKPLIKLLENKWKENPSWDIYGLGKKPTMGNNVKVNLLSVGPIKNPITDSYDIITNSFDEGIDVSKFSVYCNQLISGTYDRSIKTAYGGAKTKQLFSAMSNIVVDKPGSDCGTKLTLPIKFDSIGDANSFLYSYIINPKAKGENRHRDLIELTPEIMKDYIGKDLELRSPLFCNGEKLCNKCLGNLMYRLGIINIGLVSPRVTSSIMYKSMKSFHDQSIKTIHIDLSKYLS